MKALAAIVRAYLADVLVVAGLLLVAYGLGQTPAPWGAVLGPVALGAGLLVVVRFGAS